MNDILPLDSLQIKPYEILRLTEKEFQHHHLLHTVRQVNGQLSLKHVYQRSSVLHFTRRAAVPSTFLATHFGYVCSGEVYVYKQATTKFYEEKYHSEILHSVKLNQKVFVTSHKMHQIFGFQEYPLNWSERLLIQSSQTAKIIFFPLQLALTSFRKIFNLSLVQYRAQMLKRCDFFHDQEIEKLKKIALYSKRCQGSKGQIIVKERDPITSLIVVVTGQVCYIKKEKRTIYGRDQAVGFQDIISQRKDSQFFLSCLSQCQFILIPKSQISKLCKLKYRLQERQSIFLKTKRDNQSQTDKQQSRQKQRAIQNSTERKQSQSHWNPFKMNSISKKGRPNTSVNRGGENKPTKQLRFSTFYDQQKTTPSKPLKYFKTEGSQSDNISKVYHRQSDEQISKIGDHKVSLGELCYRKFMSRKQKRENCQIVKYLKSNAPELKLNPSRDYAVVKPLHVGHSSYVKNFKRRLKKTVNGNGQEKNRDEKKREARFSFFFKQDSIQN